MRTILAIPDKHSPYHHLDTLDFLSDLKRIWKPDEVVDLGDEADLHRLSSHDQEPDAYDIETEIKLVRDFTTDMGKLFPALKLCNSNHVRRLTSAAKRAGLPRSFGTSWGALIGAPKKWQWSDEWIIDKVRYFHGDGYSGPTATLNAVIDSGMSCVFGHLHTLAAVHWFRRHGWRRFGVCSGCLIDATDTNPATRYAKFNRSKPVLGATVIYDGDPFFVSMKV